MHLVSFDAPPPSIALLKLRLRYSTLNGLFTTERKKELSEKCAMCKCNKEFVPRTQIIVIIIIYLVLISYCREIYESWENFIFASFPLSSAGRVVIYLFIKHFYTMQASHGIFFHVRNLQIVQINRINAIKSLTGKSMHYVQVLLALVWGPTTFRIWTQGQ